MLQIVLILLLTTSVLCTREQHRLLHHLFDKYDRRIRPVSRDDQAINVTIKLTLYQLIEIAEKAQFIKISVWIDQEWTDASLAWNASDFGNITQLNLDPKSIWTPDIMLYNNMDEDVTSFGGSMNNFKTPVIINHHGRIYWYAPIILNARCRFEVKYFPFDIQHCFFKFGSASYDMSRLNVLGRDIDTRHYTPNLEWRFIKQNMIRSELEYACCPGLLYPDVTFHLYFQRGSLFYVLNLIFPILVITLLTIATFIVPAESGERLSVGVTLLLASIVFMLLVAETIPECSDEVPLVSSFFIYCMVNMFFIIISISFVTKFYHRTKSDRPMDKWTRMYIFEKLAFVVGIRHKLSCAKDDIQDSGACERLNGVITQEKEMMLMRQLQNGFENGVIEDKMKSIECGDENTQARKCGKEDTALFTCEEEWRIVGKTMDRCLFIFFTASFMLGSVYCFSLTKFQGGETLWNHTYHHIK